MKVSIIVITHNDEKTVVRCLNSIRKQEYKKIETFVIDSASTDNTHVLARQFVGKKLKIIEVRSKTSDAALANIAYKYTSGDLIFVIRANQYLRRRNIKNCVSFFKKYPEIGLMQLRSYSRRLKSKKKRRDDVITAMSNLGIPVKVRMGKQTESRFLYEIFAPANFGIFIRRKMITDDKLFDPFIETDLIFAELAWKVWACGYKVVYNPTTHLTTIRPASTTGPNVYKKLRDLLRINFILPSDLRNFNSAVLFAYLSVFISLGRFMFFKLASIVLALVWDLFALPANLIKRVQIQRHVRRRSDENFLQSLMVRRKLREIYDEFFVS